jgi:hypothetical protein
MDFNLRQGDVAKVFTYIVLVVATLKFTTMLGWVGGVGRSTTTNI